VDRLGSSLVGLGVLLHASDSGGLVGSRATGAATTTALAAVADEIVERLIQIGRHDGCLQWQKIGEDSQAEMSRHERVIDGYQNAPLRFRAFKRDSRGIAGDRQRGVLKKDEKGRVRKRRR